MDEIERAERELLAGLESRDWGRVDALLHEDFLINTAGWLPEPATKQTWLDSLGDRMSLDSFDFRLMATRHHGNVVIAIAESSQTGIHDGAPFSLTFRYTDVWVDGDSGWMLACRHASIVPTR